MKNILTFAGSDPTGGAGIQLDLKVFLRLKVRGLSVINAVTAQNTKRVHSVFALPPGIIKKQLYALSESFRIDAVKTGMIYEKEAVLILSRFIRAQGIGHLIVDPIITSSTGRRLMSAGAMRALKERLLPLSEVITPNLKEAELLTGIRISDRDSVLETLKRLHSFGCRYVVLTGGDSSDRWVRDYLFDGRELMVFRSLRFPHQYHGTGCCFSASLTVFLAEGLNVKEAVKRARQFVQRAIRNSDRVDDGLRLIGV